MCWKTNVDLLRLSTGDNMERDEEGYEERWQEIVIP